MRRFSGPLQEARGRLRESIHKGTFPRGGPDTIVIVPLGNIMIFDYMQCCILICVRTTCTEACTEKPLTIVFRLLKAVQSLVLSTIYYAWLQRAPVVFLFSAVLDNNTFSTFFHLKYLNSLHSTSGLAWHVNQFFSWYFFLIFCVYWCIDVNRPI